MKRFVLLALICFFSACAVPKAENNVNWVEQSINHKIYRLSAETDRARLKCDKLSAELLNFQEKTVAAIYNLAKGATFLYKRLEQLDSHAVANEASIMQVKKDLRDVCTTLRKYHKLPKGHACKD